jgi:hypothetical protein
MDDKWELDEEEVEKKDVEVVNGVNECQAIGNLSQWRVEDPKDHP